MVAGSTIAVLQARMSSSRLPGKVLKPLLGAPMLMRQVERARRAKSLDDVVIATSTDASDDVLVAACERHGIAWRRGSLDDVLDRYYGVAKSESAATVVRLTGDCPLLDPAVVDRVVETFASGDVDYASNTLLPTYPDGLDVEVMTFAALEDAWRNARLRSEREHVTPYIKTNTKFRRINVTHSEDLSALRWTVDEPSDFVVVERIYERLYPANPAFAMPDVLALLRARPELGDGNRHIGRDEGYRRSLANDGPTTPPKA